MHRWPSRSPKTVRKKADVWERLESKLCSSTRIEFLSGYLSILLQYLLVATFSIFFLCVCMLMRVHGCGHMNMPVCLPEVSTDCLSQSSVTLCFETGSLGEPGYHWVGDTSWPESFRNLLCLALCNGKTDTHRCAWYFTWMQWFWTQGFMLTWEALYILSHLFSPWSFYIIQKMLKCLYIL